MRKFTKIILFVAALFLLVTFLSLKIGPKTASLPSPTPFPIINIVITSTPALTETPTPTITPSLTETPTASETPRPQLTITRSPTVKPTDKNNGVITGSLSYPSEGIPEGLKICALNLVSKQEYCTDKQLKGAPEEFTYGYGYKLEVPPGDYNVYAFLPSQPSFKAYYSDFVTCGLKYDCPSHNPIKVTVKAGKVSYQVDPGDWYAPTE